MLHESLAVLLVLAGIAVTACVWSVLSEINDDGDDVLKELDCRKLIDAQETSTTRVVCREDPWVLFDDFLRPLRFIALLDWYSLICATVIGLRRVGKTALLSWQIGRRQNALKITCGHLLFIFFWGGDETPDSQCAWSIIRDERRVGPP